MIRFDKVKSSLYGGVGFRQPSAVEYAIVDDDNIASTSGLYFGDANSFVTIQNIMDCQNDKNISDTNFNTLLKTLHESIIAEVCSTVIQGQGDLVQSINLYPNEKLFDTTLDVGSRFVGFEIEPKDIINMIAKIDFLEISINETKTFNVYLYNSNLKTPIKTKECICTGGQSTIIPLTDWYVSDDATYKGGVFYIGYFETDLGTAKPYSKVWESGNVKRSTKYFEVEAVAMDVVGSTWFDVSSADYSSDTFGLNIGINIYNDYTELIIRNKELFFPIIQYGMAAKVLNLIRMTARSNTVQRITEKMIQNVEFELYGNPSIGISGVKGHYQQLIDSIKKMLFRKPLLTIDTLR